MQSLEIQATKFLALVITDLWALTPADLEQIASQLLGPLPGGWVRQGDNFVRVGNVKYGANARKLDAEHTALSAEAKRILGAGDPESVLRAAGIAKGVMLYLLP